MYTCVDNSDNRLSFIHFYLDIKRFVRLSTNSNASPSNNFLPLRLGSSGKELEWIGRRFKS